MQSLARAALAAALTLAYAGFAAADLSSMEAISQQLRTAESMHQATMNNLASLRQASEARQYSAQRPYPYSYTNIGVAVSAFVLSLISTALCLKRRRDARLARLQLPITGEPAGAAAVRVDGSPAVK